jgi:hypothetical protein
VTTWEVIEELVREETLRQEITNANKRTGPVPLGTVPPIQIARR